MYKSLIQALMSQRGTVRSKEGCGGLPPLHGPWQPVPKPGPRDRGAALAAGGTSSKRLGKCWGRAGQVSTRPEGLQWHREHASLPAKLPTVSTSQNKGIQTHPAKGSLHQVLGRTQSWHGDHRAGEVLSSIRCLHVLYYKQCCDEHWGTRVSFSSGFLSVYTIPVGLLGHKAGLFPVF